MNVYSKVVMLICQQIKGYDAFSEMANVCAENGL